ncbi:A-kinase anchor protein 1, mitochondrial isoform X3 [Parasteatoda tepidariorum]|nr:A-kinase anchor protein 1, mitochondrial isoform X2 [Parasteatoda tepidariorum]
MASCTPRIIFTLAVPIFGFLTVLFLKRKKLKSSDLKNLSDTSKTEDITDSMKLQPDYSTVVQSSKTTEMQLKENDKGTAFNGGTNGISSTANGMSTTANGMSTTANGISSTANGISTTVNGISSSANGITQQNQTTGLYRTSYAAALKVNRNVNGAVSSVKTKPKENGIGANMHTAKADNKFNQNGLKQSARTEQSTNGESSTNGVSECASTPVINKPNGVSIATTPNGVNQTSKSKSRKKNKGKMPEKNNTCSTEPTSNGCVKDKNVLVKTDNENSLSNGFSNLTVEDTSIQEIIHVTKSQEMDLNCCPTNSTVEHITSSVDSVTDTQTIVTDAVQSSNNVILIDENLMVEAAKDCDIVDQTISSENHCVTPESGRSSETLSETAETLQVDVNGHLTFPDDCIAAGGQDMLPSPEAAYCDSVGSNDSGRGGSELQFGFDSQPCSMTYEFDLHSDHCGYLIGKRGSHVNYIKEKTNALIWIRNALSPFNNEKKIVSIIASDEASINEALKLIRKRFPLAIYPDVTLERSNHVLVCPPTLKLSPPEAVEFQVVLSATVNAAHFFVQLPTHPSYHALPPFTLSMASMYTHCHAPVVTSPTVGNIVVSPVADGWFRAEIMEVFTEDDTCKLKYLDYGGYQIVPTSTLRQINFEFMQMPFQAIECYLANVTCHEELGWTEESKISFENLAQGQILSAYVAGIADDGIPCLHLYKVTGATNTFINQALVESGLAKWVSYEQ